MVARRLSSVLFALQGLRGMAALLVVLDHTHINFLTIAGNQSTIQSTQIWPFGALGVAVFFVISGFIMIHVHGGDFGGIGAPKDFFARRIARVVPFYALITLVYVLRLGLSGRMPELGDLARSLLLFIPYENPHEPYGHPVLGQGWTLNYEAFFYLVFGLAMFFRHGVYLVAVVMLEIFVAGRLGAFPSESWLGFWSQPDILFFLAGIGIGIARRSLRTGPGFSAALGLAFACIAAGVVAGFLWGTSLPPLIVLGPAAVAAVAACGLAFEQDRPSGLRRIATRIGDTTFAIYLTHTFIIGPITKFTAAHLPNLSA